MANKYPYILMILGLMLSTFVFAQEIQTQNPESEKIRGARFIAYPSYPGSPFLNDKFLMGEIELTDGTRQENIILNYGAYRDELIYYNTAISTQIVIDKKSLSGFTFIDKKGEKRTFRKLFFKGSFQGDCFFEVLSKGEISLLAYRKVNLEASDAYYSKSGMAYQPSYSYYLYAPEKGFKPVNISKKSLLSMFGKTDQKLIRKTLRKNGVYVSDESGFVKAWNLVCKNGIQPEF